MNKALTPLTEGLAKLCSKLFSEAADETGKFFAESLRQSFSRSKIKNAAEILEQTDRALFNKGADPQPISNKLLYEFLDGASLEDNETLQKLWAGLLTTALQGQETHPAYPSIIKQLTPTEAKILNYIFAQGSHISSNSPKIFCYAEVPLTTLLTLESITESLLVISIENLARLNLCTVELIESPVETFNQALAATPMRLSETFPKIELPMSPFPGASVPYPEINDRKIQLSHLGYDFVKACNP